MNEILDDIKDIFNKTRLSPDEMSLAQAVTDGVKAGTLSLAAALNPYDHETPEHKLWEAARFRAFAAKLAREVY